MNAKCYVQSALVVGFEALGNFWQCCLIHNVYEVTVKKNLRPEDLLTQYDNLAILFGLACALVPWSVTAYGWQWYARCKYNQYENGQWASLFMSLVNLVIVIYILTYSIEMFRAIQREQDMNTDYRLLPSLKRHWKNRLKYIFVSWAFVISRVPGIIASVLDFVYYLKVGSLMTMPDDMPFIIIACKSLANDFFGLLLFYVFLFYDFFKVRTRLIKCIPGCADVYCCNKVVNYSVEGRAISDKDIFLAEKRDSETHEFISKVWHHQDLEDEIVTPTSRDEHLDAVGAHLPSCELSFNELLMSEDEIKAQKKRSQKELANLTPHNDDNNVTFGKATPIKRT
jgi:hypothetical protein